MSLTKKKFSVSAIIAALSFLLLAFVPYFTSTLYYLIMSNGISFILKNIISSIFNLSNIVNFFACIVMVVGIFTRFDKIAFTVTSGLFWLVTLINIITSIVNSVKYNFYQITFISVLSQLTYLFIYFLFFALGIWFAILFFAKKETPKALKILIFIPVAILAITVCVSFFTGIISLITNLVEGYSGKIAFYLTVSSLINIFNSFVLLVGFSTAAIKLANFKKKPKNTVEINPEIVVENVISE